MHHKRKMSLISRWSPARRKKLKGEDVKNGGGEIRSVAVFLALAARKRPLESMKKTL